MAAPIIPVSFSNFIAPQHNAAIPPASQQMLRQTFLTELSRLTSPVAQHAAASQTAHSPAPSQVTFIPLTATSAPTGQAGTSTTSRSVQVKKKKSRDGASAPLAPTTAKS